MENVKNKINKETNRNKIVLALLTFGPLWIFFLHSSALKVSDDFVTFVKCSERKKVAKSSPLKLMETQAMRVF